MSSKKNKVEVGIKDETGIETQANVESYEKAVEVGAKVEEDTSPAIVASVVDHPITIKYGEEEVRISGRDRVRFPDFNKLPKQLPQGLLVKQL